MIKALKRARLGLASHPKMGESRHMPFPTAQVNLPACCPHCPSNAERQEEKL